MRDYICSVHDGLMVSTGCMISIGGNGIQIRHIFTNDLTIPFNNVKKITVCKIRNCFLFKSCFIIIEYNNGTKHNQSVRVRIAFRESLVEYISQFPWVCEFEVDN